MLMTKHKHHIDCTALLGLHRMNTYIHSYINHNEELWDTSGVLCSRHTYSWQNSLLVTFENAGWSSFNLPHEIEMIHFSQLTHYIYWHNDCSSKSRSIPHFSCPRTPRLWFLCFPFLVHCLGCVNQQLRHEVWIWHAHHCVTRSSQIRKLHLLASG